VITWQAGTMLHPGAQAKAEHRKTPPRAPATPMHAVMAATRQSGHQQSAQSRHHPGASFSLARRHYSNTITNHKNNLTPVSIFRGEDQSSLIALAAPEVPPVTTDRPLAVQAKLGAAQAMFHSQLLGELDHPVGQTITVAGITAGDKAGDKGQLELDLTGEGKTGSVVNL